MPEFGDIVNKIVFIILITVLMGSTTILAIYNPKRTDKVIDGAAYNK